MRRMLMLAAGLVAIVAAPSTARAVPIVIGGTGGTGASFTGTFDYDALTTTVTVSLTNTSPVSLGGFLTGFVFNIPDSVTGRSVVTFTQPNVFPKDEFDLLGESDFNNEEDGAPFGTFDIGAALGNSFLGGGSPNDGIAPGATGVFTFELDGSGLSALTAQDFLSALSVPTGNNTPEDFVVRFKGLRTEDGSDKVPNGPSPVPEPGTLTLLGLGLTALSAARRRNRR